jgi:hypothetical protein
MQAVDSGSVRITVPVAIIWDLSIVLFCEHDIPEIQMFPHAGERATDWKLFLRGLTEWEPSSSWRTFRIRDVFEETRDDGQRLRQ